MAEKPNQLGVSSALQQQVGMLNLRINDMMTQLNTVMKTMIEENAALKKENAELQKKIEAFEEPKAEKPK